MKYTVISLTFLFSLSLVAHNIELNNESRNSALLAMYTGEGNSSEKVPPGQKGTLEAPNENQGTLMAKLFKFDPITSELGELVAETHLNTNFFSKVTKIDAHDSPQPKIYIYQGFGEDQEFGEDF